MGSPVRGLSWRLAALAVVFALSFAAGVAAELATAKIGDGIPRWLLYPVIGLALTSLVTAIGIAGRGCPLSGMVVGGLMVGTAALILFGLGVFLPFAAGLGGREPEEFGGDLGLGASLRLLFVGSAIVGGLAGAFAGILAWWTFRPRAS